MWDKETQDELAILNVTILVNISQIFSRLVLAVGNFTSLLFIILLIIILFSWKVYLLTEIQGIQQIMVTFSVLVSDA